MPAALIDRDSLTTLPWSVARSLAPRMRQLYRDWRIAELATIIDNALQRLFAAIIK